MSEVTKRGIVERIHESGVIAIMRANSSEQLLAAAEAVLAGGVNAIEVTLTTPGALAVIEQAVKRFGDAVLFGAGTVLDPESARAAISAGAKFIVAPTTKLETIALCRRYSIPAMPGAYTPTEILTAWEAGAEVVKVFPADTLGPQFIKAVKAPLPQVRLCPTGGVTVANAGDFIRAGADVVGVGGELINNKLLEAQDFAEIAARARQFREAVAKAR